MSLPISCLIEEACFIQMTLTIFFQTCMKMANNKHLKSVFQVLYMQNKNLRVLKPHNTPTINRECFIVFL